MPTRTIGVTVFASDQQLEKLVDDGELALCRSVTEEQNPALVLAATTPSAESVARLHRVYALREELDASWATTPRELVQRDGRLALLLEDPERQGAGTILLARAIGRLDLGAFLRVAHGIAHALGRLHARGLVHRDIRPANLFVRVSDGRSWLTGFGMASKLPRERLTPAPPEVIVGTLAYMSPEQTGRMNRSIDSRSDLYSLGVTLHELATGTLPFSADNAVGWIHCHIAREPPSTADVLPPPLDAIILKLLAKTAEDRYQTAVGLAADLERCLESLQRDGRIDQFPLGAADASEHLLVPEKLYGRQPDVAVLHAAFGRVVSRGTSELLCVSGYSGVGKSSVVSELHRLLGPSQACFASGKCQPRRDVPYSALAQAIQGLLREILGKSDAELAAFCELLRAATGGEGQLLVGLLPELALMIGEQPALVELPPHEAKPRFQRVLRKLLEALASKHGALVLFLDDLQWSDVATLELVESLFSGEPLRKLLLIVAYRDNEVGPHHPLTAALTRIRSSGAALSDVVLAPLSATDLERLVADSLRTSCERVAPLTRLIRAKTDGNAFFSIQFLTQLVDEGLVAYDVARAEWSWDSERVQAKRFTENVVELMVEKLARLPALTRTAVRELACLGDVGPPGLLSLVHGEGLDQAMWEAVLAGLVCRVNDRYHFLHDRVQEAAYALVPVQERPAAHLRIARSLLERLPAERRDEAIFDLVNQYNRGASLIVSPEERRAVAELNLIAGRHARAASAYASAETYFVAGCSFLTDATWDTDHALLFELELRRAECELLIGAISASDERLSKLWERQLDRIEQAAVTCLRVVLYGSVHRNQRCVEAGLEYLRGVGITWPVRPGAEDVERALELLWQQLGERSVEELFELPLMTDPISHGTMDVLAGLLAPAYSYSPDLMVLCVAYMTRLSIERGNSHASVLAYNFLAIVLIEVPNRARDGYRFGRLALDLVERRGLDRFKARAWVVFAMGVLPWTRHLADSRELMQRAVKAVMEIGDIGYAAYAGCLGVAARLGSGDPLEEVRLEAEGVLSFAQKAGFEGGIDFLTPRLALIESLSGRALRFGWLPGEAEQERRFEAALVSGGARVDAQNVIWVRLGQLQARFLAGELGDALAAAEQARELLGCISERFERAELHFYAGLAYAGMASAEQVRAHHDELSRWAVDCPENFGCRAALVGAELARIEGRELEAERLYETALGLARQHRFVQVEALAGELAAQFHRARGFETIADAYFLPAREAYFRWGALGKVRQLDARFPGLYAGERKVSAAGSVDLPLGQLDLATVVKVSQAVSAEIVLDTLVEKVLSIAVEHAGAERGLLLLPRTGELRIEARAAATTNGVEVLRSAAPVSSSELPESILRYVARTRESVIVGDAALERGPFASDPYVRGAGLRSVLCLPLVKQARLIGVLYLENNFSPHVFTPRRIELLELLASQAAISLENAQLHTELRTVQDGLRDALGENRRMIDAIPAQAWYTRPDGSAERFNQPWLDYTGLSPERAMGWGWGLVLHPEDAANIQLRWEEIRAAGVPAEFELRQRRHDGVYRWFLVKIRPFNDENGQLMRWYGINVDIEELKLAQEGLRRSETFLAEGQRASATGSYLWRFDTNEITFSAELYAIFGFELGSPLSLDRIVERVLPEDRALVAESVERARTGMPQTNYEVRLQMPDGTLKYLSNVIPPNQDLELRKELIGVLQDVTERRLAEETVSRVRSELANMTRVASLGVLSASITHEVNQPLSGILINSGACIRMLSADPPDVRAALETVRRTLRDGKRAGEVILRLRALFSNKETSAELLDLNEATREVLALSLSELRQNRVVLRSELVADLPPVSGDRIQLQQVILNLVHNASQAMSAVQDRPRELVVRTEREGQAHARVVVSDVGVGIPDVGNEKLFEPFHTTKQNGMGIGLAVSRSIVERHGGRLRATPNRDGPGATFSFTIPLQRGDPPALSG